MNACHFQIARIAKTLISTKLVRELSEISHPTFHAWNGPWLNWSFGQHRNTWLSPLSVILHQYKAVPTANLKPTPSRQSENSVLTAHLVS